MLEDRVLLMVLQDPFRPPLSMGRRWYAFHNVWGTYIVSDLHQWPPEEYLVEVNVQFGLAIDVAPYLKMGRIS